MGDDGSIDPTLLKRAKTGDLKRVAEIVMVLSAMGEMRGGKDPTAVEKALAAEARERLTGICEAELKPKDLISREAVRVVVEDLGLNRSRDPMMGFRPTKMSIAEKLSLTKRKMEESKALTSHSSVNSPQHPPGESHGNLMHGTPMLIPDRQSPVTFSAGGFQSASPGGIHVRSLNSATSSLKQSHISDTQLASTPLQSSSMGHVEKDSPLLAQHAGTSHPRFDGRFNGPHYAAQLQATSAEKTSSTSVHSTSAAFVKPSQPSSLLDQFQGKFEGAYAVNTGQASEQIERNQETKISEVQGAATNLSIGHEPAQSVTLVPGPSFFTTHEEISKRVQKLLQPKVFDHPNWNPPSAEYTNKPINCQICKVTITDIDSLLVCDACENGTHLKCLQSYGNKEGVPKAEWHCPRCLITSNGKPFPPKYGRVTRTITPQKVPSNTVATTASSEKRLETLASRVNQQKPVANGNSGLPHLVHASHSANNSSELTQDSKTHEAAVQSGLKTEAELTPVTSINNSTERTAVVCATPSAETENSEDIKGNGTLTCNMERSTVESLLDQNGESEHSGPESPQATAAKTADQSQAPIESKETEVPISVEVSANQQEENLGPSTDESKEPSKLQGESQHKSGCDVSTDESKEAFKLQGESQYSSGCDVRLDAQDDCQAPNGKPNIIESKQHVLIETTESGAANTLLDSQDKCEVNPNRAIENDDTSFCGKPSVPDSDNIHWHGEILQVIDGKTYYQSCRINGELHDLQSHVLVSYSSQSSLPSMLQSLWEDNATGSKWAVVNQYYIPSNLPEVATCPSTPEHCEVYASNKEKTITASSICGACEVLSMEKFKEEIIRRTHLKDSSSSLHPLFMCRWMYDESKGIFQSIAE